MLFLLELFFGLCFSLVGVGEELEILGVELRVKITGHAGANGAVIFLVFFYAYIAGVFDPIEQIIAGYFRGTGRQGKEKREKNKGFHFNVLYFRGARNTILFSVERSVSLRAKLFFVFGALTLISASASAAAPKGIYEIPVTKIEGASATLAEYKGKVLLLVNTASECGFTPQYKGLEELYQKYKAQGFVVLAFPSNDFGGQEPGTEKEIKKFCELKYKTTFPLYSKVGVKEKPHPLYAFLQKETGEKVGWNFGKFLIGKKGEVVKYYPSKVTPMELGKDVEAQLAK